MAHRSAARDPALTVLAAVLVAGFLAMCAWQATRALAGNTLSWAYVFEWPLFAGYVIYMWWRLSYRSSPPATEERRPVSSTDDELEAYNQYLAALEESGRRKHW